MMLWCDNGIQNKTLNLRDKEITYVDEYGNEKKLYSDDGIYTFHLTESVFYLLGDFSDFTFYRF